jgi:hypothetical protein
MPESGGIPIPVQREPVRRMVRRLPVVLFSVLHLRMIDLAGKD